MSSINIIENGDILMGLNIGSFNSKVMTFDMKDNGYKEYDFNIHKYYKSVPKLNGDVTLPKYFEKFKKNTVPTRIMSKVVDTALYTEGTFTKDITNDVVTLDIAGPDGSQIITLPLNDFQF